MAPTTQSQQDKNPSAEYKLKKYLLLLATLVVVVTYAAGLNLPGGVWQDNDDDAKDGRRHLAGDLILLHTHHGRYLTFYYCNATAFAASVVVCLLLLILQEGKNGGVCGAVLRVVMVLDLLALMGAYAAGSCRDVFTTIYSALVMSVVLAYVVLAFSLYIISELEKRRKDGKQQEEDHQSQSQEKQYKVVSKEVQSQSQSQEEQYKVTSNEVQSQSQSQSREEKQYKVVSKEVQSQNQSQKEQYKVTSDEVQSQSQSREEQYKVNEVESQSQSQNQEEQYKVNEVESQSQNREEQYKINEVQSQSQEEKHEVANSEVLMLLATFVVTITYGGGLNPPGGFWSNIKDGQRVSLPILQDHSSARYLAFFVCNTTAFVASLVIIMLLLDKRLKKELSVRSVALYGLIVVALFGLVGAYAAGSCREIDNTVYVVSLIGVVLAYIFLHVAITKATQRCRLPCTMEINGASPRTPNAPHMSPDSSRDIGQDDVGHPLKNDDVGLEKVHDLVILLATLVASVTYQAGLDPPGGLWSDSQDGHHKVGHPVLLTTQPQRYKVAAGM